MKRHILIPLAHGIRASVRSIVQRLGGIARVGLTTLTAVRPRGLSLRLISRALLADEEFFRRQPASR